MTTTETKETKGCPDAGAEAVRSRGRPQVRSDEETREVIFDAARSEFAHTGYAATSMESVARRAGVSTKTLYRLIPNKAALFEAMVTNRIDRFVSVESQPAHGGRGIELLGDRDKRYALGVEQFDQF